MAFPLIPLLIGAGTAGLSQYQQSMANAADRRVAGETTRFSPWTNMRANPIRKVDMLGNLLKGVQSGVLASSLGAGETTTPEPTMTAGSNLGVDYSPLSEYSGVTPEAMAANIDTSQMGLDYSTLARLAGPENPAYGQGMANLASYFKMSPWRSLAMK